MKTPKRILPRTTPRSVLTERDTEILRTISWARVLTTTQVMGIFFRTKRRAERRLRALLDHGLVRARLQGESMHRDNVYTVSARGVDVIAEGLPEEKNTGRIARMPRPQRMRHALAIRDVFVEVLLAEREGVVEVADFLFEEDLAREPFFHEHHLVPDAYVLLERGGASRAIVVEVDCGTETTKTLREKFARWRMFFARQVASFGAGSLRLLVVAEREPRARTISHMVSDAGLVEHASVVTMGEVGVHLASGWPHGTAARAGRTERLPSTSEPAAFRVVGEEGDAAFRAATRTGGV